MHERKAEASNVTKSIEESFSKCRRHFIENNKITYSQRRPDNDWEESCPCPQFAKVAGCHLRTPQRHLVGELAMAPRSCRQCWLRLRSGNRFQCLLARLDEPLKPYRGLNASSGGVKCGDVDQAEELVRLNHFSNFVFCHASTSVGKIACSRSVTCRINSLIR